MTASVKTLVQYRKTLREYLNELVSPSYIVKIHSLTPFGVATNNAIQHPTRTLPHTSTTQNLFVLRSSGWQVLVRAVRGVRLFHGVLACA